MLVSVIIPTYNRATTLHKCLESALQQTYSNLEVIVIDDGSTDETENIIKKYQHIYGQKLRYFYQDNGGVSSARNMGISVAKGEYISFLDSDDILLKEKIELQIKCIEETNAESCYCNYAVINNYGNFIRTNKMTISKEKEIFSLISGEVLIQTNAWLVKKHIIDKYKLRFCEGCSWGEDIEFFIKVSYLSKLCCIKEVLFYYVLNTETETLSQFKWNQIDMDVDVWKRICSWIDQNVQEESDRKKLHDLIVYYRISARLIFQIYQNSNDIEMARHYFSRYIEDIKQIKYNNGLKSAKAFIYLLLLKIKLF